LNKKRVVVAMSGGVDSSVAAAMLHEQGYEIIGITMKTWGFMEVGGAPKHESGCCSLDAIFDAKSVANLLGIPHYTVDFTGAFEETVINNFVDEYLNGRTPNPCVVCNRLIKWEELLKKADDLDAFYVATGHYSTIEYNNSDGRYMLRRSADQKKDQTYALWGLSQESLSRTILPLGNMTKSEVRLYAENNGLKTAKKPDSQEICFVADNNYERFLRERVPELINSLPKGDMVYKGEVIGEHRGIPFYTVGQRKGLGISMGKPVYVKKIDHNSNRIEIGDKDELLERELTAVDVNFLSVPKLDKGMTVKAKIRYGDIAAEAEVVSADVKSFSIRFSSPKSAVTPGQSVVLYDENSYLLAGGIIK